MDVDEDPANGLEALPAERRRGKKDGFLLVRLSSRDCPNKKAALKSLIAGVISPGTAAAPEAHVSAESARLGTCGGIR